MRETLENTLRMNLFIEPHSLDPRKANIISESLISLLFEGLTRIGPKHTIIPTQAKGIVISKDKKTYTFHLEDRYWSDGTLVTAHDFSQTWLDLLDPLFPTGNAYLLYPIKGALLAKRGEISLQEVGIETLDNRTLRIELEAPYPPFLHMVASSRLAPICQKHAKRHENWAMQAGDTFVCNGLYQLAQWNHGKSVRLTRNPYYKGVLPSIRSVRVTFTKQEVQSWQLHEQGEVDILGMHLSPIPHLHLKSLKEKNLLNFFRAPATLFVSFNTTRFPFHNANIRRAFGTAICRKELIQRARYCGEEVALGAIPPILKGGRSPSWIEDGNVPLAITYLNQGLQELGISKKLLKGLIFTFAIEATSFASIAQVLQSQWNKAFNLDIQIQGEEGLVLLKKAEQKSNQLSLCGWKAEYFDPISLLEQLVNPDEVKNYSHWHCPSFNELIQASCYESDVEKRLDILEKAEKTLIDEMPLSPLFHYSLYFLLHPRLKGFAVNPLGQICFDSLWIEELR